MNNDFEQQLREALRPVDPDDGFADRIMARIHKPVRSSGANRSRWLVTALAASMVAGAAIIYQYQVDRASEGFEARRQLIEALKVTGEKLDLAYQVVNRESDPAPTANTGA